MKVALLYLWVLFNVNVDGKDKEPIDLGFQRSSRGGNFGIAATTIAEIELKSISAIVVAAIAGEWFPYDRYDH